MADDDASRPDENVTPHVDDGYTDGMIGPMYGLQRLSLPAEKLPHEAEPVHRQRLWVGIPWKIILVACAGVVVALVVFGAIFTLPFLGHSSDRFSGTWRTESGARVVRIVKTDGGWNVREQGQTLRAVEQKGQLVTSGQGTVLTIQQDGSHLIMTVAGGQPIVLVRQ